MATVGKGSSGGKEKRGTSPSGPVIKKTPKPSTSTPASSSSSPTKEKASSPTDGKPVPNYLKPTISSNPDFSRLPKKSPTDSAAQTPIRRRSFDRPPPVAQVQKAIRNVSGPKEIKPLRSSSFSHKSTTSSSSSTRPAPDKIYARTVSTLKEGKIEPIMSKSRSLKKSTLSPSITPNTKRSSNSTTSASSSKKKAPKSVTSESSVDQDNVSVDHLVIEDDLVNIENETQSLPEISDLPDQKLGDPSITVTDIEVKPIENVEESPDVREHENEQEEKSVDIDQDHQVIEETETNESKTIDNKEVENDENQTVETPPKSEQENVLESIEEQQNMTVEEEQNLTAEEKQNSTVEEEQTSTVEEQNLTLEEQNITVESKEGDVEKQNVEKKEIAAPAEEKKEDETLEQQVEKGGEELLEAKVEIPNVSATPATPDTPDTPDTPATPATPAPATTPASPKPETTKVQTPNSGKKDKEDYNDVIERTTSKLMGGRKNKVLAMAGAFETVISLEGPKKK